MNRSNALLTVILASPGSPELLQSSLEALLAQQVQAGWDILLTSTQAGDPKWRRHWSQRMPQLRWEIYDSRLPSTGSRIAAALPQVRSRWFCYGEEHSYPRPDWSSQLQQALREQATASAIGWSVGNANPGAVSWAQLQPPAPSSVDGG